MSIEEIIKELSLEGSGYEEMIAVGTVTDRVKKRWERRAIAMREAIALLRTHPEAQPNEPLTLEELREMDGQPVWLNVAGGVWALVGVADGVFWMDLGGSIDMAHLEGKAYRRPPKEVEDALRRE